MTSFTCLRSEADWRPHAGYPEKSTCEVLGVRLPTPIFPESQRCRAAPGPLVLRVWSADLQQLWPPGTGPHWPLAPDPACRTPVGGCAHSGGSAELLRGPM